MVYSQLGHVKKTYVFEFEGKMYTVETEEINPNVFGNEPHTHTFTFFEEDGSVVENGDPRIDKIKKQLDVFIGFSDWVYVDED